MLNQYSPIFPVSDENKQFVTHCTKRLERELSEYVTQWVTLFIPCQCKTSLALDTNIVSSVSTTVVQTSHTHTLFYWHVEVLFLHVSWWRPCSVNLVNYQAEARFFTVERGVHIIYNRITENKCLVQWIACNMLGMVTFVAKPLWSVM